MATADEQCISQYPEQISRLNVAMEYLQEFDPRDFTEEEYEELEQAIWKLWVWSGLRDQMRSDMLGVERDMQACLKVLRGISGDIRYYVDRSQRGGAGHRRFASCGSRYDTHSPAKEE